MGVMAMVVRSVLGEDRGCKHHQEECGCKKLFHALNVARSGCRW
jgi:hypothetical protein